MKSSVLPGKIKFEKIALIIGIISLLPFVITAFFNHPSMDDYCFAVVSRKYGVIGAVWDWYENWSGRYFFSFLLSLNLFDLERLWLVRTIPIVLMVSLAGSFYWLADTVLVGVRSRDKLVLSLSFMTVYLYQMPSVAEGFYWLAGSLCYQVPNVLTLVFLVFSAKLIKSGDWKYAVAMVILAFAIIGSNETSMLLLDFIVFVIFLLDYLRNRKVGRWLALVLFFMAVFSLVVILAPGNKVREANFVHGHDIARSAMLSFVFAGYFFLKWISFMLLFFMFMADGMIKTDIQKNFRPWAVHPLPGLGIVFCLILLGFLPAAWSMGGGPPPRTIDVIYFAFLLGVLYLFFSLNTWLEDRNFEIVLKSPVVRIFLLVLIISGLVNPNNIRTAYEDLASGKVFQYDREHRERELLLGAATGDTCYLPELTSRPSTIFVQDIASGQGDWSNQCLADYKGLKAVLLKEK